MKLVRPTTGHLPEYISALERGWSPDNLRPEVAQEQLAAISEDPNRFLERLEDREAKGPPVALPDGSCVPRLPGFRRWIWEDGFCGSIGLRWQPGTEDLPPHCSGHVGYAVVPWRRNAGLASAALIALLPEARAIGLRYVEVTTSPSNLASARVLEKAGAVFIEEFRMEEELGGEVARRYQIPLA